MGLFPLEDVRTMFFELSLIRSAFSRGAFFPAVFSGTALSGAVFAVQHGSIT